MIMKTKNENDSQLEVLGEKTKETPQRIFKTLPKSLPSMPSSETLKLRKTRFESILCQTKISTHKILHIICCLCFTLFEMKMR